MHTNITDTPFSTPLGAARTRIADTFAMLASDCWRIQGDRPAARALVHEICRRPEIRLLARGVTFRTGVEIAEPFRVAEPWFVEVSLQAESEVAALVVHIRHALEIAAWHRICPAPRAPAVEIAAAALACCTALRYLDTLPAADREAALDANPDWFRYLARLFRHRQRSESSDRVAAASSDVEPSDRDRDLQLAAGLVGFCARLLPLQGTQADPVCNDPRLEADAVSLTADLLPLAPPTERLLASGGDSRLTIDPRTRLNKYGCSTTPRPSAITFSSCTASSASDIGYWSAEEARQRLIQAVAAGQCYTTACAGLVEETRRDLAQVLGTNAIPDADIVLAASGTDCELFALHAALEGHNSELLSIVIGPDEIGSGSLPAANGRHFDDVAPLTYEVSAGTPVEGLPVERVRVHTLRLRDDTGQPFSLDQIDAEVATLAREAVIARKRVLLHVVDSSKTGMRAPSLGAVRRLQRELGDSLTVLVDAAQMRTRTERLLACVADGIMVMISGSKFFTGAPFSGALIMPPHLADRMRRAANVPRGFSAYISGLEVPPTWTRFRSALPATPNLGLVMRWRTALAEMRAFQLVPLSEQNEWYRAIRESAAAALRESPRLARIGAPVADRTTMASDGDWDGFPTTFTFMLRGPDDSGSGTTLLDYAHAWDIYVALNRDVAPQLPPEATAEERALAATACHIGQPVKIKGPDGQIKGALRVAIGARYISRLAFDSTLGRTPEDRMAAQIDDLRRALAKTELIVRYWTHLRSRSAVA